MVGRAAVRRGLHLGQRPPVANLRIGLLYSTWRTVAEAGIGVGFAMRWIYDSSSARSAASPYPMRPYGVPKATPMPRATLDLQVGEMVRVKPYKEILKTLDSNYRNRGLYFDAEMVPFTEREYEVERRQKQIIDEAIRQDGPLQDRRHRPERRRLRGALRDLPPLLPARDLSLLARDLAGARSRQRSESKARRCEAQIRNDRLARTAAPTSILRRTRPMRALAGLRCIAA